MGEFKFLEAFLPSTSLCRSTTTTSAHYSTFLLRSDEFYVHVRKRLLDLWHQPIYYLSRHRFMGRHVYRIKARDKWQEEQKSG